MYSQTELIREIFDLVGVDFDLQRDNNSANRGLRSLQKALDDLKSLSRLTTHISTTFTANPSKNEVAGWGFKNDGSPFDIIISRHFVYKKDVISVKFGETDAEVFQGNAGTYFNVPQGIGTFTVSYRPSSVSLFKGDTGNIYLLPAEKSFVVASGAEYLALLEQQYDILPFLKNATFEAQKFLKLQSQTHTTRKFSGGELWTTA